MTAPREPFFQPDEMRTILEAHVGKCTEQDAETLASILNRLVGPLLAQIEFLREKLARDQNELAGAEERLGKLRAEIEQAPIVYLQVVGTRFFIVSRSDEFAITHKASLVGIKELGE